jgi:hypothetical protein
MALVHAVSAASAIVMTVRTSSLELGKLDGLAAGLADAAVQCVLDDQGAERFVLAPTEDVDDERMCARVLAAGPAPAEAARPERRALARPAVQPHTPPTAAPSPAAPT